MYKIDIPANRYDLLCIEGLARALRVFLGEVFIGSVYFFGSVARVLYSVYAYHVSRNSTTVAPLVNRQ